MSKTRYIITSISTLFGIYLIWSFLCWDFYSMIDYFMGIPDMDFKERICVLGMFLFKQMADIGASMPNVKADKSEVTT